MPQALPLIRLARPDMTLARWRRQARHYLGANSRSGGILVVKGARGYLQGILTYRIEPLSGGTRLTVDDFVVGGLVDRGATAAMMLGAVDDLAATHGCASVHTTIADSAHVLDLDGKVLGPFRDRGHRLAGCKLTKTVARAAAR
ncbi:MAG: hypothetical protein JNM30_03765 [Rhodospirillales bacterium]|nr:hypothetical protein [Rhodospirillales bacterium]